jgi:polysaccharide biosynthesis protein PslG
MATLSRVRQTRRQVRTFVLVWGAITLLMGMATFLAIYFTYRSANAPDNNLSVALGAPDNGQPVTIPSITPQPVTATHTALPTIAPTQAVVAQVVASETATDVPPPTATATPTEIPPAQYDGFEVGIQVQFSLDMNPNTQDSYYNPVKNQLGLNWVKTQVRWEEFEPEKGVYNWSILDLVMPSSQKFGLKQLLSIVTAPDWAREAGVNLEKHGPPANNQDYVNFVSALLQRYPGQVGAIEVWNEMNIDREWTSTRGLSAVNYVSLLRDTYQAVKAIDPGIIIITGALSPTGFNDGVGAYDDFVYTDLLIQAGALDYADCYGAHVNGYNMPPDVRYNEGYNDPSAIFRGPSDNPHHSWSFLSTLEGYATRIAAAGRKTKLCVTEFGWAVSEDIGGYPRGFEFAQDNTLAEQAEYFSKALTIMEESGYVRLASVWNLNYGPQAGWSKDNDNVPYSLIGPNFSFRPAYDAIGAWVADYKARTGQP